MSGLTTNLNTLVEDIHKALMALLITALSATYFDWI